MRRPGRVEAEILSGYSNRSPSNEELRSLYQKSPFAATLVELTRSSILIDWNIGYSNDGSTLFWYQDFQGKFVNAKRIRFSNDGFTGRRTSPKFSIQKNRWIWSLPLRRTSTPSWICEPHRE